MEQHCLFPFSFIYITLFRSLNGADCQRKRRRNLSLSLSLKIFQNGERITKRHVEKNIYRIYYRFECNRQLLRFLVSEFISAISLAGTLRRGHGTTPGFMGINRSCYLKPSSYLYSLILFINKVQESISGIFFLS